mgnify:CR=1 FL=1
MQDMEFTVENEKLFMLQTRNGKRTPAAALKIACDLVDATPVPEVSPMLPKTIICTLTAVPQEEGMSFMRR